MQNNIYVNMLDREYIYYIYTSNMCSLLNFSYRLAKGKGCI